MKVTVEFKAPQTIEGLRSLVALWESHAPHAKAVNLTAYGEFTLTLRMPPATQVMPPQLVDPTGTFE